MLRQAAVKFGATSIFLLVRYNGQAQAVLIVEDVSHADVLETALQQALQGENTDGVSCRRFMSSSKLD